MSLHFQPAEPLPHSGPVPAAAEERYDAETLRKVVSLAERLQAQQRETLSAADIEQAGAEVGLQPEFIRRALAQVREQQAAEAARTAAPQAARQRGARRQRAAQQGATSARAPHSRFWTAMAATWWSAGWTLPFILTPLSSGVGLSGELTGGVFFASWGLYIGGGMLASMLAGDQNSGRAAAEALPREAVVAELERVGRSQAAPPASLACLAVEVSGAEELRTAAPRSALILLQRLQQQLGSTVQAQGGHLLPAGTDGYVAAFPDPAGALRAARELQLGMRSFNGEHAARGIGTPLALRCAVAAGVPAAEAPGDLAILQSEATERACRLAGAAAEGDVLVGGELAAVGLTELGALARLPGEPAEPPVFSWMAALRGRQ